MKLKVGIIANDTIKTKILDALKEADYRDVELYPRWYSHQNESVTLARDLNQKTDVILFSGPVPYFLAKKEGVLTVPADYVSFDDVSLMKGFFELQIMGVDLSTISIDTITDSTIIRVCKELNISYKRMKIKPLTEENVDEDFTQFHAEHFLKGNTTFALTCRTIVYDELTKRDIPCHHLLWTNASIINAFNRLINSYQRSRYRGAQIAIGLIKVKTPAIVQERILHSRRNHIEIQQRLLNCSEQLKAGLTELGEGLYVFYTTYGVLKQVTKSFTEFPDLTELKQFNVSFYIGIGTGDTVSVAEEGARKALMKAEKEGDGHVFIIIDNANLIGPIGQTTGRLIVRTESPKLRMLAKEIGITATSLAKMIQLVREEGRHTFSAEQLAAEIGLSTRSARRIITHLMRRGLAEAIGEEALFAQGRPKRIYRIHLDFINQFE